MRQLIVALALLGTQIPHAGAGEAGKPGGNGREMTPPRFHYGFRYDAMGWLRQSPSLGAAVLRRKFGLDLRPDDPDRLDAEVAKVLSEQRDDGLIAKVDAEDPLYETGGAVLKAFFYGCPIDRPEIRRASASMLTELERRQSKGQAEKKLLPQHAALCMAGMQGHPAVRKAVADGAEELRRYGAADAFGPGVARTPNQRISRLWLCREAGDTDDVLEQWLRWMDDGLDETGCGGTVGLFLLWDVLELMGTIDHAIAERRARKLVPVLQRLQQPDGSWGDRLSYWAGHLVLTYGFLEELEGLPPLPSDWEVAHAVPIPCESPFSLAWDGSRLWVQDKNTHTASAISRKDGRVLATVKLPGQSGEGVLGAGPGCLYLAIGGDDRTFYKIDPGSGEVQRQASFPPGAVLGIAEMAGRIVIADHWDGHMHETSATHPADPQSWKRWRSAAGMPNFITAAGDDALWISDGLCPLLIKSARDGRLLDWGEKPFGWGGIAWDGENLWALDRGGARVCIVVKAGHRAPAKLGI